LIIDNIFLGLMGKKKKRREGSLICPEGLILAILLTTIFLLISISRQGRGIGMYAPTAEQ